MVGINPESIIKQQLQIEKNMNKKHEEGFFEKLRKRLMPKKSVVTIKQKGNLQVKSSFIGKIKFSL